MNFIIMKYKKNLRSFIIIFKFVPCKFKILYAIKSSKKVCSRLLRNFFILKDLIKNSNHLDL